MTRYAFLDETPVENDPIFGVCGASRIPPNAETVDEVRDAWLSYATTLGVIAPQVREWSDRNFGYNPGDLSNPALGIIEEIGELCHAKLKMRQGIRYTREEAITRIDDALADASIFWCDLMTRAHPGEIERRFAYIRGLDRRLTSDFGRASLLRISQVADFLRECSSEDAEDISVSACAALPGSVCRDMRYLSYISSATLSSGRGIGPDNAFDALWLDDERAVCAPLNFFRVAVALGRHVQMGEVLGETWAKVSRRDWGSNPMGAAAGANA